MSVGKRGEASRIGHESKRKVAYRNANTTLVYLTRKQHEAERSNKAKCLAPAAVQVLTFFYDNGYWLQLFPARLGVCIPSTCSGEDLQKMAAKGTRKLATFNKTLLSSFLWPFVTHFLSLLTWPICSSSRVINILADAGTMFLSSAMKNTGILWRVLERCIEEQRK